MRLNLYLLPFLLLLASCDVINPEEEIPAFIHIDHIDFETTSEQGTASHNFSDAWVYVNGEYIGTYELPATFPVLKSGQNDVLVFAGVKDNGFSSTRIQYGFCSPHESSIDLVPGETVTIEPSVAYLENILSYEFIDFEDPIFNLVPVSASDTTILRIDNPNAELSFLEDHVGAVYLDEDRPTFRIETNLFLPLGGVNFCYLELDYMNSTRFFTGLKLSNSAIAQVSLIGMNPSLDSSGNTEWNKIYIDLSEAIDVLGNAPQFELFFQGGIETGEESILIDNVKVVYSN